MAEIKCVCDTRCECLEKLEAENARLQTLVDILEQEREEHRQHTQDYKALAERRRKALEAIEGEIDALDDMGERLSVVEEALAIKVLIRKHVTRLNRALSGGDEARAAIAAEEEG